MRLLHTSDWHLGRRLGEASLMEDQAYALDQVFTVCRDENVDALLIAGDLYDRAIPPESAVRLLSDFLERLRRELGIPCIAISGNHDSAERLGFSAGLLEAGGIHLRTRFEDRARPIPVGGGDEAGLVFCLPYVEPTFARHSLEADSPLSHDAAVRGALAACHRARESRGCRNSVLIGHLFAQGGEESPDSERPLVVGGAAQVSGEALDGWCYVALGHLHRPQPVAGRAHVRYSGSLLKYSFAEATHAKSLTLVEVSAGEARPHLVPLTSRRDVVRLEDTFDALLKDERYRFAESAYVEATYTDTDFLVDTKARLQRRFPHLLSVRARIFERAGEARGLREHAAASPLDGRALLSGFWAHVMPDVPLRPDQQAAFEEFFQARFLAPSAERMPHAEPAHREGAEA